MPARALLVLLLMLNVGLAAWWLLRPAAAPAVVPPLPEGVIRLQLLSERTLAPRPARPVPAPASVVEPPAPGEAPAVATADAAADAGSLQPTTAVARCFTLGPFPDAAAAARARGVLGAPGVARILPRTATAAPRGWRVLLPPLPDRSAADAAATRIRAAGFDDLLVVPEGDEANAIALGRYGSEASARRRAAALQAAGFAAEAQPVGEARVSTWLDVAADAAFDLDAARRAAAPAALASIDCAALPPPAAR